MDRSKWKRTELIPKWIIPEWNGKTETLSKFLNDLVQRTSVKSIKYDNDTDINNLYQYVPHDFDY